MFCAIFYASHHVDNSNTSLLVDFTLDPSPIYPLSTSDQTLLSCQPQSETSASFLKGQHERSVLCKQCPVAQYIQYTISHIFRLKTQDRFQDGFIFNIHINNFKLFCICFNQNCMKTILQNNNEIAPSKIFLCEMV